LIHRLLIFVLPFIILLFEIFFQILSDYPGGQTNMVIFMTSWMVSWWIFGIAPLGITGLIPLVFLPLMNILSIKELTPYYSDSMIFLFLGGFILARGLEKTELSERFALKVLTVTGRSDGGIVVGFIIATASLSMWISNTATAIMMIPIAQSVIHFLKINTEHSEKDIRNISTVIYLSIAYAANIGGTVTPIGTPPNVLFIGYLENLYHIKIDFWKWVVVMAPVAFVLLGLQYFFLNWLFKYKIAITGEFRHFVQKKVKELDPFNSAQKLALGIFFLSCFLWIFKDPLNHLVASNLLNDTSIAILGGCLLFFVPYNLKGFKRILDHDDIATLPWNIILLFGGGMAMAGSMEKFGIIQSMVSMFDHLPASSPYLITFMIATLVLVLTEVMSNVALCMVALPMIMTLAQAKGIDPVLVGLPAAISASYAFSLPISTPPNAIVFGTNKITMKDMLKAGIVMNIMGLFSLMTLGWFMIKIFFDS